MLTESATAKLKPTGKPYGKRHGGIPGLFLNVYPSGRKTWVLFYRPRGTGKQVKHTLGVFPVLSVAEAAKQASAILLAAEGGANPHREKLHAKRAGGKDGDLFEVVLERFLAAPGKRGNRRERTVKEWRRLIEKEANPAWKGKRIQTIERKDVRAVLDAVAERGVRVGHNRLFTALSALFNFALSKDLIAASPMAGLSKLPEQSRDRVLTDDELRRLWLALDETAAPVGPFVKFLLLIGCRRSEAAGLAWSEIDKEARTWLLPAARSKNRQERLTPLTDAVLDLIDSVPRVAQSDFVFTYSGKHPLSFSDSHKVKLDALSGVTDWTLHDLRRSCASKMQELGFAPVICEAVLGHRLATGVAKVYQRYEYRNEKRAALEAWSRFVLDNAAGKSAQVVPLTKKRKAKAS